MKPDLSIVIVSYNTRQLLKECLDSVYASLAESTLTSEVIVVDNASRDGSAAMVQKHFPQVSLIANEENRGFAAANNQALRAIGYGARDTPHPSPPPYAMLLNPDTVVGANALTTLVRFMDANSGAGACGARLLHSDGSFQHSAFAFPTLFQVFLDFFPINYRLTDSRLNGRYPRRLYQASEPFPIDHPLGAALMVRRGAIEQVGLLDERFFIYCEEIDWCLRIKATGWGIWCVPEAEIVHHVARSTGQFRDEMFAALWKSRYQLFEKHYSRLFQWMARRIVRLGLWAEVERARAAARQREITESELTSRLTAYRRVARMGQRSKGE
ncbi:MAG: glycosyltransferase family 2 protein [Anaerolineae bacterium]|nr:glycosyltransferase family 2 protein [Anaerolineae bacterium]